MFMDDETNNLLVLSTGEIKIVISILRLKLLLYTDYSQDAARDVERLEKKCR